MKELADRPIRIPSEPLMRHYIRVIRWILELRLVPKWQEGYAGPLSRIYRKFFYDGLTYPGKVIFITSTIVFFFGFRSPGSFLSYTAAIGYSILIANGFLGRIACPSLTLKRECQKKGIANSEITSMVTLSNNGARSLFNFTIREMTNSDITVPKEYKLSLRDQLAAKSTTTIPVSFTPRQRGILQLSGLCVQTYFPFFLTRICTKIISPATLYILPDASSMVTRSIRQIAQNAASTLLDGSVNNKKNGISEYIYSRQYQMGDSTKRIDHRASGRRGKPMSKIFEGIKKSGDRSLFIIFDNSLKTFLPWQRRPQNTTILNNRLSLLVEVKQKAKNEGLTLESLFIKGQWTKMDSPLAFHKHISTCPGSKKIVLPEYLPSPHGLYIILIGRWNNTIAFHINTWQKIVSPVLVFLLPETEKDRGTLPVLKGYMEIQG